MKPEIWGRHMWYSIHFIALNYPEEPSIDDMRYYKSFYENLHQVIPCYKCSVNYVKHLNERPLELSDLQNSKTLFNWTVDIHNIVNKELKKPIMSQDVAWLFYNNPNNFKNTHKNNANANVNYALMLVIACLLLFIILYIIYSRRKNYK
jgi:hypothetical protein